MDVQPSNSPKENWRPRTDEGARKLVERIDGFRGELEVVKAKGVTTGQALSGLGLCIFGVFALLGWVVTRAEAAAKEAGQAAYEKAQEALAAQRALEVFVKTDLQDLRREIRADMSDLKSEVRNTTKAVERSRPKPPRDGGQ